MGREVGGSVKKEGTYVYLWLIHVHVWQKPTQYCKAIILQLKINESKKRCPPVGEWINKLWDIHTIECYSVLNISELLSHEKNMEEIHITK